MNEALNKRKDRAVKLCKPVVLSLFLMLAGACDKGDDDPCEPIPEPIEDSIQNPIKDTIQNPIKDTIQNPINDTIQDVSKNPIEVNKSRETVNELSDEMKQDVIAYFQNIFCPIWNALWADRPDLQFNPEEFPDIINQSDVRYGDEYFELNKGAVGYYSPGGYYIRLRPNVDFWTIIHEFIHYLLDWKNYPETEETKRLLKIALGPLSNRSNPTYNAEKNGEYHTTVNEIRAEMVTEIATSLGKSIQDITVEGLHQYIDEMQVEDLLRAIAVNGYVRTSSLRHATAYLARRKNIEQTKKDCDTSCLSQSFFTWGNDKRFFDVEWDDLPDIEHFLYGELRAHLKGDLTMSIQEAEEYLRDVIKKLTSESQKTCEDNIAKYEQQLKDYKELTSEEYRNKYRGNSRAEETINQEIALAKRILELKEGTRKEEDITNTIQSLFQKINDKKTQIRLETEEGNPEIEERVKTLRYVLKHIADAHTIEIIDVDFGDEGPTIDFADAKKKYCDQQSGGNEAMAA